LFKQRIIFLLLDILSSGLETLNRINQNFIYIFANIKERNLKRNLNILSEESYLRNLTLLCDVIRGLQYFLRNMGEIV